jgi:hypothetical protein
VLASPSRPNAGCACAPGETRAPDPISAWARCRRGPARPAGRRRAPAPRRGLRRSRSAPACTVPMAPGPVGQPVARLDDLGRRNGLPGFGRLERAGGCLEQIAEVHDLDANRMRVEVVVAVPAAFPGMPGAAVQAHELRHRTVRIHQQVRGDAIAPGAAQEGGGRRRRVAAGVVEDQEAGPDLGVVVRRLAALDRVAARALPRQQVVLDREHRV